MIANTNNNIASQAYNMGTGSSRLNSNTVTFRDDNPQWDVSMKGSDDGSRFVAVHDDVSLDSFFARPIPIFSSTWTPGAALTNTSFNPWTLFMTNVRVSNRMSNYKLFAGNLHLKIMVNGNAFYYGRAMVSYLPYGLSDTAAVNATIGSTSSLVQNSQRLKIFVDPTVSQGGTMELPFLWHNDMIDLTTSEYVSLGYVTVEELVALKHANGASSPITISIYAWMSNVKLAAPTAIDMAAIAPQAGDEYGSTPMSAIASSMARATGALSRVPIIGPYARATSMAAGALSGIFKMFGYSRPVDLEHTKPVKQRPLGELACTDIVDGSVKLTVDSKQELTIDPTIIGLGRNDEMALLSIAGRETYVNSFVWTTAGVADTLLYNIRVGPIFARLVTGTLGSIKTIPACTYAALPFKYWRGTMRYRFQITSSNFHKGRMKVVWDPIMCPTTSESNVQYTKIVDISNERDFVIDVSWGMTKAWLQCLSLGSVSATNMMSTTRYNTVSPNNNGVLSIFILNELATPNSAINNDITINVFMSMCEDAEFSAPVSVANFSPADSSVQPQSGFEQIVPQAGEEDGVGADVDNAPTAIDSTEEFVPCAPIASGEDLVYMGEHVNSLRQLIKRYNVDYHYATIASGIYTMTISDFPMKYAYTPYGIRGTSPNKYDIGATGLMRYCAMAFLFYRGGIRRKYVVSTNNNTGFVSLSTITRSENQNSYSAPTTTPITITSANTISDAMATLTPNGQAGMAIAPLRLNPVVEAELPFYRDVRFALCRRPNSVATATTSIPFIEDMTHNFTCNQYGTTTATSFTSLVSAAEDSAFFCFQGCQPFYINPILV